MTSSRTSSQSMSSSMTMPPTSRPSAPGSSVARTGRSPRAPRGRPGRSSPREDPRCRRPRSRPVDARARPAARGRRCARAPATARRPMPPPGRRRAAPGRSPRGGRPTPRAPARRSWSDPCGDANAHRRQRVRRAPWSARRASERQRASRGGDQGHSAANSERSEPNQSCLPPPNMISSQLGTEARPLRRAGRPAGSSARASSSALGPRGVVVLDAVELGGARQRVGLVEVGLDRRLGAQRAVRQPGGRRCSGRARR